ncbi:phosphatase PAP2 family protein [Streptomyces sp. ALI-76-A]|jgi:undecaprenyl-diphosphatase|uniref:phosphatase PAP2 family protein n=1 Tax=Streptomyces sp. ALI-76-A TaxID=3025736 RepID=UPI00256F0475|nr:phosphatase PAP2 family protein [Streptomyces sp. ALI-76-A]MDL5199314.1 phosphatase PAP2 family protein [Streptomyces sp. ALI-76-A]
MNVRTDLRERDHRLTRWVASWRSDFARRVLPAVEESAQHTKLWWGAAIAMSTVGWRGRRAAAAGLTSMAVAELSSNCVLKQVLHRPRPPKDWISHEDVDERPDSSSFPSGHTAAGVAFSAGVAAVWPWAGAVCAVPAAMVAAERVHTGAHYPSDVAVGAVVGLAAAALVHRAPRLAVRRLL